MNSEDYKVIISTFLFPTDLLLRILLPYIGVICEKCPFYLEEKELAALEKARVPYRQCNRCLIQCKATCTPAPVLQALESLHHVCLCPWRGIAEEFKNGLCPNHALPNSPRDLDLQLCVECRNLSMGRSFSFWIYP